MHIFIRKQDKNDILFYETCLCNTEFLLNFWGHKRISVKEFLNSYSYENYMIGLSDKYPNPSGFCIFRNYLDTSSYFFYGGIDPSLFNSGVGVYLCVAMLEHFFKKHNNARIFGNVFNSNSRSMKMLKALGFSEYEKRVDSIMLINDIDNFLNSKLSILLKERMEVEIK